MFKGIPSFSPEIFQELENLDPMKSKQLEKGIRQLIDEGVAQLFIQQPGNRKIVGTVGQLQFEVINYRLINEYGAKCQFVPRNYFKACWITTENEEQLETFKKAKYNLLARDKDDNLVFLAETTFLLTMAERDYPDLTFHIEHQNSCLTNRKVQMFTFVYATCSIRFSFLFVSFDFLRR